ncbi:MAG: hypothetical protein N5P05_000306 [Chroococcopsis gigantea SAG 12.99]|nr:hypothetical protein [Chroococcopsis gigantea SAG 12.99]
MEPSTRQLAALRMHRIVWILVGVFGAFAFTFPIAMWRVSTMEKFRGSHVKSLTIEGQLPTTVTRK